MRRPLRSRLLPKILAVLLSIGVPAAARPQAGAITRPATPAQQRPVSKAPQPLTAEEREELAARAEEPGPEVAGGALSNLHLTYIVIALAAAVLVLILK